MQDCPEAKKPCKGILKTSSSFDKTGASFRKSAKFDELNVLQTLHPADKDYGHMKIDEPKTPYNYADSGEPDQLDAELLADKLRIAANTQSPSFGDDDVLSDEEFPESEEEKIRREEFEHRRKKHYNEYEAVRLARKLIREELGDDEEELTVDDESSIHSIDDIQKPQQQPQEEHFEEESRKLSSERATTPTTEPTTLPTNRSTDLDISHPCYGRTSATD